MTSCPVGAITSFPLGISIIPTQNLYEGNSDRSISGLTIQWNTKTTAPQFINTNSSGGVLNELSDATTLRYNGTKYTLSRAQICAQTHSGWILPTGQNNKEDIILIFSNDMDSVLVSNIIIVVPIIRGNGVTDPSYLRGLSDTTLTGTFSLKDCVPSSGMYIHYVSCLEGYASRANASNASVFVSSDGIAVSDVLMRAILSKNGLGSAFPAFQAPFMTALRGSLTIGIGSNTLDKYVSTTTRLFVDPASFASRTDSTDKYKCVPLDPDASVVNGAIQVNTDTGELLTDVLSARKGMMAADVQAGAIDPGRIEYAVSILLGIVFGILFLSFGGYIINYYVFGAGTVAAPATASGAVVTPSSITSNIFFYLKWGGLGGFLLLLGMIAGYVMGLFIRRS